MKKLSKKAVNTSRGIMIVMVSIMGTITLAACSINYNQLADGINQLGRGVDRAVNGSHVTKSDSDDDDEDEPTASEETTEPTETAPDETTPAATPTPTPKPTATPTPLPQRVDFSELTTDTISEGLEVQIEEFTESFHAEGEETELVTFTGERLAVSIPGNENVQTSLNLMYDAFYQEALGLYNRYSEEATAAYGLDPDTYLVAPYGISVNYKYAFNGRLLAVDMTYCVMKGDGEEAQMVASRSESLSMDVLTGQYVNLMLVSKDPDAFAYALSAYLANAQSIDGNQYTPDMVSDVALIAQANTDSTNFAIIRGNINGIPSEAVVDLGNYADYLNTYGKIVYKINQ